jgi:hypothetical protein
MIFVKGNMKRFWLAIAYQLDGFAAVIKVLFLNIIKQQTVFTFQYNQQFTSGLQLNFK